MEQYIQTLPDFTVLVRCFTFNHSSYITDALNGFTMQQTNFPYVVVLVDDASTDGEQEIIKKYVKDNFCSSAYETETDYANITFVQHRTNHNCYIAVYYLKENHYSQKKKKAPYVNPWREKCKYEALCEGDDYWIDPLKLQKQVDIMDEQIDVGLVHTAFDIVGEDSLLLKEEDIPPFYRTLEPNLSSGYIYDKLFNNPSSILTCTILFRIGKYETKIDHDLFMQVAKKYKIAYVDSITSCYRILPNSMMRSRYNYVESKLFETISAHMLSFYSGDKEINEHYNTSKIQNEVDLFFSKYITSYLKRGRIFKIPIKTIFNVLYKNPRLLIKTPFNIIKRLC